MAQAKDYKSDSSLDLVISNGDFVRTPSDQQASLLLMNFNIGSLKFHPFAGMGIKRYEGSDGTQLIMKRNIIVQHKADGMDNIKVLTPNPLNQFDFFITFTRPGYDD